VPDIVSSGGKIVYYKGSVVFHFITGISRLEIGGRASTINQGEDSLLADIYLVSFELVKEREILPYGGIVRDTIYAVMNLERLIWLLN
jgi:predicted mannosyl-3-phosphoglycerate phosphatase (HAD superfamily)